MKTIISLLFVGTFVCGCASNTRIESALNEHPEIIFSVLQKNPEMFAEALKTNRIEMRRRFHAKSEQESKALREAELRNPKQPKISADRAILGIANAPLTLVEYSDFQCPYCARGFQTVKEIIRKYGKDVRFIYKHLPLDRHPMAVTAAEYFEGIAQQSAKKAYLFHDYVFQHQDQLSEGKVSLLDKTAKRVGANMPKLKKALASETIKKRVEEDVAEAKSFGFEGTPGFLLNGVSIRGASPLSTFDDLIAQLTTKNPTELQGTTDRPSSVKTATSRSNTPAS